MPEGKRRNTVVLERSWINEYSSINMENIHSQALIGSLKRAHSKADSASNFSQEQNHLASQHYLSTILTAFEQQSLLFANATQIGFDIWDFRSKVGDFHTLPFLGLYLLRQLPGKPTMEAPFCEEKLASFLSSIQAGYRSSVQYHNSIHGADVA